MEATPLRQIGSRPVLSWVTGMSVFLPGGLGLLRDSQSKMRIVHGNTLTAAAVVETGRQSQFFRCEKDVFFTAIVHTLPLLRVPLAQGKRCIF